MSRFFASKGFTVSCLTCNGSGTRETVVDGCGVASDACPVCDGSGEMSEAPCLCERHGRCQWLDTGVCRLEEAENAR